MTGANPDLQRVIDKCRDNGCLLLVLIYDDDSCSEMTAVWSSEEVTSAINAYKCEKIQFSSGSLEYVNFTRCYPVLVTPAIFIISNDGVPLDMLYGNLTSEELTRKINKAIEVHRSGKTRLLVTQQRLTTQRDSNKAVGSVRLSSVVNRRKATQSDKADYSRRAQQTTNSSRKAASSSPGSSVDRTVLHRDTGLRSTASPLASSNICRLQLRYVSSNKKLIQQFHPSDTLCVVKEYASKEFGIPIDAIILEKSYPAYRFVVEDEMKSLKELQLTPTATLIVKQKMADYSRRAQQTTNSSTRAASSSPGSSVDRTVLHRDTGLRSTANPSASSNICRLQLRYVSSNKKLIQQFRPSDTLCVVKEHASKELGIPIDVIILEKSYPAYRFVVEDEMKSLSELQLTPTAMLIVKQKMTDSWSSVMLSRVFDVLFYLLSLIVWPLQLLGRFIYGSSSISSSSASQTSSGSRSNSRPNNRKGNSWQRRGNVASFRQDDEDDDDDQNTYNGNSTQQQ